MLDADESHKLKNRVKYSYEKLLKTVGRRFTEYPRADLEAYFLSPLMGQFAKRKEKQRAQLEKDKGCSLPVDNEVMTTAEATNEFT